MTGYVRLFENGELSKRHNSLRERLENCKLCPHECGVNRLRGETGKCRSGAAAVVASAGPHYGEEKPLVGHGGSGTIFFSNCNLACVFCQNHDISQLGGGREVTAWELARVMVDLQNRGCVNINFVTPTHVITAIVGALLEAVPLGLRLPVVYNCGGYESVETLKLLDGVIDIYMPDFKYADESTGEKLSGAQAYPSEAAAAIREMHRQVGDLVIDRNSGSAARGLLIRHLVMPGDVSGSKKIIDFVAELSKNTYLNIMDQYRPMYRAAEVARASRGDSTLPDLGRRVTIDEYDEVVTYARKSGLTRIDA